MSVEHQLLPALLGLRNPGLREIKKALTGHGVPPRGWRLYADYGDALFAVLDEGWRDTRQPQHTLARLLSLLKLLAGCEMDVLPSPSLLGSISQWQLPDNDPALVPVGLFRAFWKACIVAEYQHTERATAIAEFVRTEIVPCAQWYFGSGQHMNASPSWRNAGWSHIRERWQQALYEEITCGTRRPRMALAGAEWPMFVARVEYNGLVFQGLHNAATLRAEGRHMSHCVGGYALRCQLSMLRIYAITDGRSGARLGTVSVRELAPGRWEIDELKAHNNEDVAPMVECAADAVVRSLADAYYTQTGVRREMNAHRSAALRAAAKHPSSCFDEIDDEFYF